MTWNISNVGAAADTLAEAYGVSLAVVGLFTTSLFVTHLLVQIPGGRAADRIGARSVGFLAIAAVVAGNLLLLVAHEAALAIPARAVVGLGSGAGFVAGAEYMRAVRATPILQGVYGAATMAGGGLAIAIVPLLVPALGWRAPYWSALAAAAVSAAVLAAASAPARRRVVTRRGLVGGRPLVRLGLLHGATFGLSVVAANWIVPLLERYGEPRATAAALGSLLLLGGLVTRPLGGFVASNRPALVGALLAGSAASRCSPSTPRSRCSALRPRPRAWPPACRSLRCSSARSERGRMRPERRSASSTPGRSRRSWSALRCSGSRSRYPATVASASRAWPCSGPRRSRPCR